jgi:hypothetical protein
MPLSNDQVNPCMWTIPSDCWPLWINGNRREIQRGWKAYRESGEKDYDQRTKYVSKGEEVAAGLARAVLEMQKRWRMERYDLAVADGCSYVKWIDGTAICGLSKHR